MSLTTIASTKEVIWTWVPFWEQLNDGEQKAISNIVNSLKKYWVQNPNLENIVKVYIERRDTIWKISPKSNYRFFLFLLLTWLWSWLKLNLYRGPLRKIAINTSKKLIEWLNISEYWNIKWTLSDEEILAWISRIQQSIVENPNNFVSIYFDEFVKPYEAANTINRYNIIDYVNNLWWVINYESAIVCWNVTIWWKKYAIVWHNKSISWWRASAADHQKAIEYIEKYESENLPIIFWIDTPWADSGKDANVNHQAKVMSLLIDKVTTLTVPSISILVGEWWSGWAEVFMWTDFRACMKDSYFSTIHPIWQSNIIKWRHSPAEISWLMKVDPFNLKQKWVVDWIFNWTLSKEQEISFDDISNQVSEFIANSFEKIQSINRNYAKKLKITEEESRDQLKRARLYRSSTSMLFQSSDNSWFEEMSFNYLYQFDVVLNDFIQEFSQLDKWVINNPQEVNNFFIWFVSTQLQNWKITKFNINDFLHSFSEVVWWEWIYTWEDLVFFKETLSGVWLNDFQIRNIRWILRHNIKILTNFFGILEVLINPSNYKNFFIAWDNGLIYSKSQIDKIFMKIYESLPDSLISLGFDWWKASFSKNFQEIIQDKKRFDLFSDIMNSYRMAHMDMPKTIVNLVWMLIDLFINQINVDSNWGEYVLKANPKFAIDYSEKAEYEKILEFSRLIKDFKKIKLKDIKEAFLEEFTETDSNLKREAQTVLDNVDNNSPSIVTWIWMLKWVKWDFAIAMGDFSVNAWTIDWTSAKKIILLLQRAAKLNIPVIMFHHSGWMYVNWWPTTVSSMSALNRAIYDYYKTTGKQVISIPIWVATGWTIASFAQSKYCKVAAISLSEMMFAGRIVTPEILPLENTVADFQLKSDTKPNWIDAVLLNPFVDQSLYNQLQTLFGINLPKYNLSQYLVEELWFNWTNSYQKTAPITWESIKGTKFKENCDLFKPFKKVAILNRWIIATLAINACKNLWLDYSLFFTQFDEKQRYVIESPDKMQLPDYMTNPNVIIHAMKFHGIEAVYLWYWFWSENADFIRKCEDAWIVVIWAKAENVYLMWDKLTARKSMKELLEKIWNQDNIWPAKGSDDIYKELSTNLSWEFIQENWWLVTTEWQKLVDKDWLLWSNEWAILCANKIWYPVILKSRFGGWGKWIKVVKNNQDILENFDKLSAEAQSAFWDGSMYLEKAMTNQRHVEVQVFSDIAWNAVTMWLRDCTVQRRGQKLIEETWCLDIPRDQQLKLQEIVRELIKNIWYVWAGTVEFLYSEDTWFTFMEMNTRIQVEHTITQKHLQENWIKIKLSEDKKEEPIDLIKLQLAIASWKTNLFPKQEDIDKCFESWYTAEIRLCAEDPANDFTWIQTANIQSFILPKKIKWCKVSVVSHMKQWYDTWCNTWRWDSMIAQLIISAKDKQQVAKWLAQLLSEMEVEWIPTNAEFLIRILNSQEYLAWDFRIDTLNKDSEWERLYFNWLEKFDWFVSYAIENDEDSVELEEWEFVIRAWWPFAYYEAAKPWDNPFINIWEQIDLSNSEKTLFLYEVSKAFRTKKDLTDLYIIDHNWNRKEIEDIQKFEIVRKIIKNWSKVAPWNALFVIKMI